MDIVVGRDWAGIKNGELLRRMRVLRGLVTMERGIAFQHNVLVLPFGIVVVPARSNRIGI